ncbi:MAG: hypothetical protein II913_01280 [Elusimicrobiaceae bacterium]|nr:hypothetical protein [Elusimicrobiaceae bacterium]
MAQNRIEMYTYFPVPYVAYNNIFMVGGTAEEPADFQVGFTNNFRLNLGSENKTSLKAETVTLKSSNTLTFNTDVYTKTATFGTANTADNAHYGDATLTFNNLRVGQLTETVSNGPDEEHGKVVEKITADQVTVKGRVAMNTSAFTSADAAKLPDCSDEVRWSKLKFGGQEHYFLTCGYTGTGSGGGEDECPSGHHWEWELAGSDLTCVYKGDRLAYGDIIQNAMSAPQEEGRRAIYALTNGIIQNSSCTSGETSWSFGDPLYFVEYNASTLCQYHLPQSGGEVCLESDNSAGTSGSHFSLPYCSELSTPPMGSQEWNPSIPCSNVNEDITWFKGMNQENGPRITLYKAVCVDD